MSLRTIVVFLVFATLVYETRAYPSEGISSECHLIKKNVRHLHKKFNEAINTELARSDCKHNCEFIKWNLERGFTNALITFSKCRPSYCETTLDDPFSLTKTVMGTSIMNHVIELAERKLERDLEFLLDNFCDM